MNDKYIVYFISQTKKKMTAFIERQLSDSTLSNLIPTHGNVFTALYENDNKLTMKELARIIGKDKSTVTPLVNKLVKMGYVIKEKSTEDARVTYIMLSEKGLAAEPEYAKISAAVNITAYDGFTPEEKAELLRLLKKLSMNFSHKE